MNRAIAAAVLVFTVGLAGYTQLTRSPSSTSGGYYGLNQAKRGKDLYGKNCSSCHLDTLKANCSGEYRHNIYAALLHRRGFIQQG